MVVELFLDEEKVDLDDGTTIAETKQINDFFEIADRQTSYTNTFKLPKTERNKMLLGGHGIAGVTSLAPYRLHKVSVYRNGLPTIQGGIGYLKETSDSYNMYVYSENISMFDTLGDKTLADLNLQPLTHELNLANWYQSFSRNDYVYALADYGKLDSDVVEINYQVPALYVKYLWNKIFQESGFQWEYFGRGGRQDFSPFQDPDWEKLAITINEGLPQNEENTTLDLRLTLTKTEYKTATVSANIGEVVQKVNFTPLWDPDNIHVTYPNSGVNGSKIRIWEPGFYRIQVTGDFNNIQTENAGCYIYKNNSTELFVLEDNYGDNITPIGFTQTAYFQEGDLIDFRIKIVPENHQYAYSYTLNVNVYLDNSVAVVNFGNYLSNIKQKDFIKDVLQHYGLLFRRAGAKYQFMCLQELLDPNAVYDNYDAFEDNTVYDNWSNKFDSVDALETDLGGYARKNWLRYKYESAEDRWADDFIPVDDQTLEADKTQLTKIYKAPAGSFSFLNNKRLRKCDFFDKELNDDGTLKSVKPKKGDAYLFKVEKEQGTVTYKIANADGSNTLSTNLPYMVFTGLDFNTLIPKHYAAFTNMLTYAKKYTVSLHLNVADIHTLDFFKLKYIKQLGGLFYLNKISNYTGKGLTKAELIRVRSLEKLGEFDDSFSTAFSS